MPHRAELKEDKKKVLIDKHLRPKIKAIMDKQLPRLLD